MKRIVLVFASLLPAIALASACGAEDEFDNTVDCAQICTRFDECVAEIDIADCTDQCEDDADASSAVEQAADSCEECLDDATCEGAEPCWSDCPVVPVAR